MISRSTLFSNPGGDTIQMSSTAKYLRRLGITVDIKLSNEEIDYSKYDVLHFFNIIRPADTLIHIKKSEKSFIITPIFIDYSEYERNSRKGILRILNRVTPSDEIEYLKAIARMIKNKEKIKSLKYLIKGHKNSIKYLLKRASLLLPNSYSEYKRISEKYGIYKKFLVIPNGIDNELFNLNCGDEEEFKDSIICVGRIEGLKNQLNVIKALKDTNYKLFIIGRPSNNHIKYYEQCKKESTGNIKFINYTPQKGLVSIYKSAKVCVMASWFETTGLASLEAAVMGCNVVITDKGDAREYLKDSAFYCKPDSVDSIREAVVNAYETPVNPELRRYILQNFTWEKAAQRTLEGYKMALES